MGLFLFETNENQSLSPIPQPFLTPSLAQTLHYNFVNKISPSILLIIIILALIFFISGLLHLLVRYLFRPTYNDQEDLDNSSTAFQGQLQHLFHLHDAGVDQSYIDKLPVFSYKSIIGLKNPFDCAVCLCEFESEDSLRLLPKCSHAFHLECIDTWLLSHSTCPLCRCSLIPDFSTSTTFSPIVLVLESASESFRENVTDREGTTISGSNTHVGLHREDEFGSSRNGFQNKSCEIPVRDEAIAMISEAKVVPVKLGKLRNVDVSGNVEASSSGNINVDARRCYSMGSFEYVLDDRSQLQVAIKLPDRKPASKKPSLPPLTPRHRVAMSECDFHSSREVFKGFDMFRSTETYRDVTNSISTNTSTGAIGNRRTECFSVSKIWLQSNKETASTKVESSRRALSFRLPLYQTAADELKPKHGSSRRAVSEIYVGGWENGGSEMEFDEEVGRCDSLENCKANAPSFAKRTLLWLVGRQKKVIQSSSTTNV